MAKPFTGTINVDIRDSEPDWTPFEPPVAPHGAPNVMYIVLDDVGFSALNCYGGPIETPNIDRIANQGVRYTQWHTTALCSPTRSCLLTGRNHTRNSMACITEAAIGFPNGSGTIPPENGMVSEILSSAAGPRPWSSSRTPRCWRPTSRSSCTTPQARATRRTTRPESGSISSAAASTWATKRSANRRSPSRRKWASSRRDGVQHAVQDVEAVRVQRRHRRSLPDLLAGHARGEIRHQYHHAIDIVPTILDVLGIDAPAQIKGYTQSHFDGVSMRYSFDDAGAKTARRTQFYSMLGSRGIWHDGWKAVTTHVGAMAWGDYANDTWELYHTETDRSECHDLAAQEPGRLRDLVNLWHVEAGANSALPLDDRGPVEILTTPRPVLTAPRDAYVYYPDTAEVPEAQAVNVRNRSYSIGALVDIPAPGAQGVLFAHGSWFGGHALYVKDNRLHYVYNFVGATEQRISADRDISTGEKLILSASFEKQGEGPQGIANGILSLYYGDQKVGEGRIKTQPGKFAIGGEGLCVGRDSGEAVTDDYPGTAPWRFTGGTIRQVQVNVSGKPYVDLEREAVAMMARE